MKTWLMATVLTAVTILVVAGCGTSTRTGFPEHAKQAEDLFGRFGWRIVGDPVESSDVLPNDFSLRTGQFPWRVYLDLSSDAGLDFSSLAGTRVNTRRFRVDDSQGDRLTDIRDRYLLWGVTLLDQQGKVSGAWLTYTDKQGNFEPGIPGYSLQAKDREQVTGLTWPQYSQKYSPAQ